MNNEPQTVNLAENPEVAQHTIDELTKTQIRSVLLYSRLYEMCNVFNELCQDWDTVSQSQLGKANDVLAESQKLLTDIKTGIV